MGSSKQDLTNKDTYKGVISSIACGVASQVEGVASVSYEVGYNGPAFTPSRKKRTSAISVTLTDDTATIDIAVNVFYGYVIPQVVCDMQEKIKHAVENSTYYKVKEGSVCVAGVVFND